MPQYQQSRLGRQYIYKIVLFSFHACSVALSVVSLKHSRRKELVGCDMLGEDVTTEVGHSTARVIMATLAATEGQLVDVTLTENHTSPL